MVMFVKNVNKKNNFLIVEGAILPLVSLANDFDEDQGTRRKWKHVPLHLLFPQRLCSNWFICLLISL